MKRRIGIESPLKGNYERNQRYARWCMYDSLQRGEAPFASHLLYTQVLDDTHPEHREMGISAGEAFYDTTDARAFYVDLDWSNGMARAARRARRRWFTFWCLLKCAVRTLFVARTEERRLPPAMLAAFKAGYEPNGAVLATFERNQTPTLRED